jgi:uncharacterized repeat protein (TIGR03806 family)
MRPGTFVTPSRGVLLAVLSFACNGSKSDDTSGDTPASTSSAATSSTATTETTSESPTGTTTGVDTSSGSETGAMPACPDGQGVDLAGTIPQKLSEMCLVRWDGAKLSYEANVYGYDLNTVLFSDYAVKDRAIYIPPGTTATYVDNAVIDLPVGTVILKSFMFPADMREPELNIDLIETRVLVRYPDAWKAYPYVWDHELGDAVLKVQGETRMIDFIGPDGAPRSANYLVPQKNQCLECHEIKDEQGETILTPIGPSPRYLNRDAAYLPEPKNQLVHFAEAGWLLGVPPIDQVPAAWDIRSLDNTAVEDMDYATITAAARDYLDINCAYCHNPRGVNGISSQLFLNWDNEDVFHLGYCKKPGSAGKGGENRDYDIVPGDAEASILIYRTETLDLGSMMPLIGRSLQDNQGSALLRAWIDGLPPDDCQAP